VSYKEFRLSPHTSTRGTRLRIVSRGPASRTAETFEYLTLRRWDDLGFADRDLAELDFMLSDFEARGGVVAGRSFWNMFLGFAVIVGISGGFWTGVGLLVARLLK